MRGDRTYSEYRSVLYRLYPRFGELALRHGGRFLSVGKHMARDLQQHAPDLFAVLEDAMRAAHNDEPLANHIKALDEQLCHYGGYLFDGYRQDSAADKRKEAIWLK